MNAVNELECQYKLNVGFEETYVIEAGYTLVIMLTDVIRKENDVENSW